MDEEYGCWLAGGAEENGAAGEGLLGEDPWT